MSKELIEKLRNKAYVTELGDQQSAGSDEEAMRHAADAIERLELEAVAATVRVENDAAIIMGLRELVLGALQCTDKDQQAADELRTELAALKNQPHIARATGKNSGDYSEVSRVYETPLPAGVALYLAPSAQPKGMVPLTRHQVNSLLESAGYVEPQERADFINGIRHCEVAHGIKAMLEAAKETK